ncbi:MAG: DUF188 domain-containing protein [Eubacterium sp.]|nr:DUF188 domain-containing protein [Eubacterium sp.]
MRILVDADACSVVNKVEKIAKKNNIEVILFCDTHHVITSDYAEVKIVGAGADAVDFAILNNCKSGDIVVTNDGGLASLVLSKRGMVVNSFGRRYTDRDINDILNARYFRSKQKRRGNTNFKGMKNKNYHNHPDFNTSLTMMIGNVSNMANVAMAM